MTVPDLFFIASVLFVLVVAGRMALAVVRGRFDVAGRFARWLGVFMVVYALVLVAVSLAMPRRFYAPGERRCFDDWCVTVSTAKIADDAVQPTCGAVGGSRVWLVEAEVASAAVRVRQRARDVWAELEDREGARYEPCSEPQRLLSDDLGPGERFRVQLPFRLPGGAMPAGVVVHHGDFPGSAIIGADQAWLHSPALQNLALDNVLVH